MYIHDNIINSYFVFKFCNNCETNINQLFTVALRTKAIHYPQFENAYDILFSFKNNAFINFVLKVIFQVLAENLDYYEYLSLMSWHCRKIVNNINISIMTDSNIANKNDLKSHKLTKTDYIKIQPQVRVYAHTYICMYVCRQYGSALVQCPTSPTQFNSSREAPN